jgi:hypothetical protein
MNSGKTLIAECDKCNRQEEVCNRKTGRNKWRIGARVPFAMHNIGKRRRQTEKLSMHVEWLEERRKTC